MDIINLKRKKMEQILVWLILGLAVLVVLVFWLREIELKANLSVLLHMLIEDADNRFTARVVKISEKDAYSRIWCVVSVFRERGNFFKKPVYRDVKFYFSASSQHDYYIGQVLGIEALNFEPETRILMVSKVIPL